MLRLIPCSLVALGSSQIAFWPAAQGFLMTLGLTSKDLWLLTLLCCLHCFQQEGAAALQVVPVIDTNDAHAYMTICSVDHSHTSSLLRTSMPALRTMSSI